MSRRSGSGGEQAVTTRARALGFLHRFVGARRGGIIPLAAAGVPVVALLAIAATELASLSQEKGRMQDVADAVALDAANQLSFSRGDSVLARAEANARNQLLSMEPRTTLTIRAEMAGPNGVRVAVNGTRLSFFGNMLPPGGFKTAVEATATSMNTAPLCVVMLDPERVLEVTDTAKVDAGQCLIHSNGNIETKDLGRLQASAIQAGGWSKGVGMNPAAQQGAKAIADPFASTTFALPAGCADQDKQLVNASSASLTAGRHCGQVRIGGTTVRLAPGVHVFNGEIRLEQGARLIGDDVLLVFETGAKFAVQAADVRMNMKGLRTGDAGVRGFVFAAAPGRVDAIELPAGHIERLEGVVYAPEARVVILDGRTSLLGEVIGGVTSLLFMGASSKWTVIVADDLLVSQTSNLVVNADYRGSDVPVPAGVGDRVERLTRLTH